MRRVSLKQRQAKRKQKKKEKSTSSSALEAVKKALKKKPRRTPEELAKHLIGLAKALKEDRYIDPMRNLERVN